MSERMSFTLDGITVEADAGQTIMEASDVAGIYIPRLCSKPGLSPHGSCRVCTVLVNGRPQAACTQPVGPGAIVESAGEKMTEMRRRIVEMLFVEGNHFCPFCEKSGDCELQALAYRLGIAAPRYPFQFPTRDVDASHPDLFIDHNRCVVCGRCVRASKELDGKNVFQFVERGPMKRVAVNSVADLAGTDADVADEAMAMCPVGAIIKKRVGYATPYGHRLYDTTPIGADIEAKRSPEGGGG